MVADRRKSTRQQTYGAQALIITSRGYFYGSVVDAGETGLFVAGEGRMRARDTVWVRIWEPEDATDVIGKVVRADPRHGFAVEIQECRHRPVELNPWGFLPAVFAGALSAPDTAKPAGAGAEPRFQIEAVGHPQLLRLAEEGAAAHSFHGPFGRPAGVLGGR